MKKPLLLLFLLITTLTWAQENMPVYMHYVTVKSSDADKLISLEKNYFSKMHKQNIDSGKKIGWDMWRMENQSDAGHTTFVYTHLQHSLDEMELSGGGSDLFSEAELKMANEQWASMIVSSKLLVTSFKGGFAPIKEEPVNVVQLGFMNVDPLSYYEYEQMELKNFLPAHKKNPLVRGWALHSIDTPHAEDEDDYLVANFFETLNHMYKNSGSVSQLSKQEKANYKAILNLRKMTKVEVLTLVMAER